MKRGFSLFEILLALFIMSMIVVGGIQWSKRKHEEAAAQQLGLRLFQYGMAVSEYARQNPDGYTSNNLPPNNLYGINWLKAKTNPESCYPDNNHCQTFLGQDFNFNLSDLRVEPLYPGMDDTQIHVELEPPVTDKVGPLNVKLIIVGKVLRFTTGTQPYQVDISLDSRAVNFANQYNDQSGTAEITYTLAPLNENAQITGVPSTTAPNIDTGYLRTDGSNEMDNSIRFSSTALNKKVEGVKELQFDDSETAKASGLQTLTFNNNTTTEIGNLATISGLNKLNFSNGNLFHGLASMPSGANAGQPTNSYYCTGDKRTTQLPPIPSDLQRQCFLIEVLNGNCRVSPTEISCNGSTNTVCRAMCITW